MKTTFRLKDYDFKTFAEVSKATGIAESTLRALTGATGASDKFYLSYGQDALAQAISLGGVAVAVERAAAAGKKPLQNAGGVGSLVQGKSTAQLGAQLELGKLRGQLDTRIAELQQTMQTAPTPAAFFQLSVYQIARAAAEKIGQSEVFDKAQGPWSKDNAADLPKALIRYAEGVDAKGAVDPTLAFLAPTIDVVAKALTLGGDFYPALDKAIAEAGTREKGDYGPVPSFSVSKTWIGDQSFMLPIGLYETGGRFNANLAHPALEYLAHNLSAKEQKAYRQRLDAMEIFPAIEVFNAVKKGVVTPRLAAAIGGGEAIDAAAVKKALTEQYALFGPHYVATESKLEETLGSHLRVLAARGPGADAEAKLRAVLPFGGAPPDELRRERPYLDHRPHPKLGVSGEAPTRVLDEALLDWSRADDAVFELFQGYSKLPYDKKYGGHGSGQTALADRYDAVAGFIVSRGQFDEHRWMGKLFEAAVEIDAGASFARFGALAQWVQDRQAQGDDGPARLMRRLEDATAVANDPESLRAIVGFISYLTDRARSRTAEPLTLLEQNVAALFAQGGDLSKPRAVLGMLQRVGAKTSLEAGIHDAIGGKVKVAGVTPEQIQAWSQQPIAYVELRDRPPAGLEGLEPRIDLEAKQTSDGRTHQTIQQAFFWESMIAAEEKLHALLKSPKAAGVDPPAFKSGKASIPHTAATIAQVIEELRQVLPVALGGDAARLAQFDAQPSSAEIGKLLEDTPLASVHRRLRSLSGNNEFATPELAAAASAASTPAFPNKPQDPALAAIHKELTSIQGSALGTVMFFPTKHYATFAKVLSATLEETPGPNTRSKQIAALQDGGALLQALGNAVAAEKPELKQAVDRILAFAARGLSPEASLDQREAALAALLSFPSMLLSFFAAAGAQGAETAGLSMYGSQGSTALELGSLARTAKDGGTKRNMARHVGAAMALALSAGPAFGKNHPAAAVLEAAATAAADKLGAGQTGAALIAITEGLGNGLQATEHGKKSMNVMLYLGVEAMSA